MVPTTLYKHFKGKLYNVYGLVKPNDKLKKNVILKARYSEDIHCIVNIYKDDDGNLYSNFDKDVVLYQADYGKKEWWVRPVNDFYGDKVFDNGTTTKRFVKLS